MKVSRHNLLSGCLRGLQGGLSCQFAYGFDFLVVWMGRNTKRQRSCLDARLRTSCGH